MPVKKLKGGSVSLVDPTIEEIEWYIDYTKEGIEKENLILKTRVRKLEKLITDYEKLIERARVNWGRIGSEIAMQYLVKELEELKNV